MKRAVSLVTREKVLARKLAKNKAEVTASSASKVKVPKNTPARNSNGKFKRSKAQKAGKGKKQQKKEEEEEDEKE